MGLEQSLYQTKHSNPHHFIIHGERGIGKSSLMLFFEGVAQGSLPSLSGTGFRFLTASIELEPSATYHDIIHKLGAELRRTIAKHQPAEEFAKAIWQFMKRWEVMGVKINEHERQPSPHELLDELVDTAEQTLRTLGSLFDGIVFLIDEADKPTKEANLGEFCKLFTERLSKRGQNNIMLGLSGLSGLITKLRESHDSSPRVFQILTLRPLQMSERIEVIRRALQEAREINQYDVTITQEAEEWLANLSEGYPHFIQQFGYSAFETDSDNIIDKKDVSDGAFKENGGLHQLGVKYFEELYFDKIASDEYRDVLRAMSEHWQGWVTKGQIRKATNLRETTLANAIAALKARGIIQAQDGKKGVYRLPTTSFAAWIKLFTYPRKSTAPNVADGATN